MDPILAETIAPFLAIFGIGTMVLIGMKLRYNHRPGSLIGPVVRKMRSD